MANGLIRTTTGYGWDSSVGADTGSTQGHGVAKYFFFRSTWSRAGRRWGLGSVHVWAPGKAALNPGPADASGHWRPPLDLAVALPPILPQGAYGRGEGHDCGPYHAIGKPPTPRKRKTVYLPTPLLRFR